MKALAGSVLLVLFAAGCGGGGAAPSSALPQPGTPSAQGGMASLRIAIPVGNAIGSSARRAKTVTAAVVGATVAVGLHGGSQTTSAFDLSGTSGLCTTTASVRTCTLNVTSPLGADDFAVTTYDAAPVGGAIPTSAHILGIAKLSNVTIVFGSATPITMTVLQEIGSIGLAANTVNVTYPADGTAHNGAVVINPTDFANAPIVTTTSAPYANPITVTLAETGGTGHVHLLINGSPATSPATISQSGQTLSATYDGLGASGYYASIAFSASGVPTQTLNVVPMYVTPTSTYYAAGALGFTAALESATFAISEALGTNAYTATIAGGPACAASITTGAVTGAGASGSFSVSSNNTASGTGCSVVIKDANLAGISIPFTNTLTTGGPIQIGGITEYAMPAGSNGPLSIAAGVDGNMYVGDSASSSIDQFSTIGSATMCGLPTTTYRMLARPDGSLWFTNSSNVIKKMTSCGAVTTVYTGTTDTFTEIANGPDGNVWVSDVSIPQVLDIGPTGAIVATYSLVITPGALVAGSDGNMYVAANGSNEVDIINPATGITRMGGITTSPLSQIACCVTIAGTPNLFGTEYSVNKIWHSPLGLSGFTETPTPGTSPTGITIGPDFNVWITETNDIAVNYPGTTTFKTFTIPTAGAGATHIATGPDGNLWFTEITANKVGVLTP